MADHRNWRLSRGIGTASRIAAAMALLLSTIVALEGCGCGFDCNSNSGNKAPAVLSLGFSDESLEELKQVVIEVDSITLGRTGTEDVIVDTFTIDELGLSGADSFQIDLLQYRGINQLLVIEELQLDAATYSTLEVSVLDGDVNQSYVQESDDSLKQLNVSGNILSLPGPALSSGTQLFTVEFSLAQALQFQDDSEDYLLTTEGIRVMDNALSASLSGRVEAALFDLVAPCDAKSDPEAGNRIYLYAGVSLSANGLADVFTSDSTTQVPGNALAPFAVASLLRDALTGNWQYAFGFLPAGDYTLALACDAAGDDPVDFDNIVIPLPSDQLYEIELSEGEAATCDLAEGASCS